MEYRAISLHQPWASLIALGIKKYETRSWNTKFRGKLLICSAKKEYNPKKQISPNLVTNEYDVTRPETYLDRMEKICNLAGLQPFDKERLQFFRSLPLGKVLCIVDLVNCLKMESYPPYSIVLGENIVLENVSELEQLCGDWQVGRYAWELINLTLTPQPIPIKGKQGLWIPDSSIITEVEKQLSIG